MGLPVESPLRQIEIPPGHSIDEWNQAYAKVESYLAALRLRNKFLHGSVRLPHSRPCHPPARRETATAPTELAMEEAVKVINDWVGQVLQIDVADTPHRITTQGRLAMLLADVPGKWQEIFLTPGPWPEAFVKAMRESYLRAGPDFQISRMQPRPLDFGPIHTLTTLNKRPYLKMVLVWLLLMVCRCPSSSWLRTEPMTDARPATPRHGAGRAGRRSFACTIRCAAGAGCFCLFRSALVLAGREHAGCSPTCCGGSTGPNWHTVLLALFFILSFAASLRVSACGLRVSGAALGRPRPGHATQ